MRANDRREVELICCSYALEVGPGAHVNRKMGVLTISLSLFLSLSPSDRNFVILAEGVPGERRVCRHLARFIRFLHLASFAPNLLQVRFLSILRLASLQFDVI